MAIQEVRRMEHQFMSTALKPRVAGKVSMDMITIDLTDVPEPKIGDRVELFGDNISIDEVADYCNTISYEIFTQISKRVYKSFI